MRIEKTSLVLNCFVTLVFSSYVVFVLLNVLLNMSDVYWYFSANQHFQPNGYRSAQVAVWH